MTQGDYSGSFSVTSTDSPWILNASICFSGGFVRLSTS